MFAKSPGARALHFIRTRPLFRICVVAAMTPGLGLFSVPVQANPRGGVVVHGDVEMSGGRGNLRITQNSRNAIINWEEFSIGANELTQFIQPGKNAAVLNRVTGSASSLLEGSLRANGNVFLINPNGILVGAGGTIDVHGLVLSTLDVNNGEFLSGGDMLFEGASEAGVKNMGRINAIGGDVFLIGRTIENSGSISATGTVGLGAGQEVLLTANETATGERMFVRTKGAGASGTGILNDGTIEGAAVELKAHGNLYALAINNKGSVRAVGADTSGGSVYLRGAGGTVENSGTIRATAPDYSSAARVLIEAAYAKVGGQVDVSGASGGEVAFSGSENVDVTGSVDATASNGVGGSVTIEAPEISLANGSIVDASGSDGGGSVRIGGGFQGKDASISNAETLTVADGAEIYANSTNSGDAGEVFLWADDSTVFQGHVGAEAQGTSGDGGFVEVSGKDELTFDGTVSTLAANGQTGTLLLDPTDLTISNGAASANNVNVGDLTTALGSNNVVVSTDPIGTDDGDISVNDNVTYTSSNALTLLAHGDINFNASVQNGGDGDVNAVAGWDGTTGFVAASPGGSETGTVDMMDFFSDSDSYGNAKTNGGFGSIILDNSSRRIVVGSRHGDTQMVGYGIDFFMGSNASSRDLLIGYRDVNSDTGANAATGNIHVEVHNEIALLNSSIGRTEYSKIGIGHGGTGSDTGPGPGDLSGNITVITGVDGKGTGNITLVNEGVSAGNGAERERVGIQIGHGGYRIHGNHSGTIIVDTTQGTVGNITFQGGDGKRDYAMIGHGGVDIGSSATGVSTTPLNMSGNIEVRAGGNVDFTAGAARGAAPSQSWRTSGDSFTQIGHGGRNSDGTHTGSILVEADGDIRFRSGDQERNFAMLGHGGQGTNGDHSGQIDVTSGGAIIFDARGLGGEPDTNDRDEAFVQLGHGGYGSRGDTSGTINVDAGGNIEFYGGNVSPGGISASRSYAQLGHGGYETDNPNNDVSSPGPNGEINVTGNGDLLFTAGNGDNSYVQLGHGGISAKGLQDGDINVDVDGAITFTAGRRLGYAQLGHGGYDADGVKTGNIDVSAGSDITFLGGVGTTARDFRAHAQLGHGGYGTDGAHSGDIFVDSGGAILFKGGNLADNFVLLGHGGRSRSASNVSGFSGDIDVSAATGITFTAGTMLERTLANGFQDLSPYSNLPDDANITNGDDGIYADGRIFAMLGHGGYDGDASANNTYNPGVGHTGDIRVVTADGDITFNGGDAANLGSEGANEGRLHFALLGHGGVASLGDHTGAIEVEATLGNVVFNGGAQTKDGEVNRDTGVVTEDKTDVYNFSKLGHGGVAAHWGNSTNAGGRLSAASAGGTLGLTDGISVTAGNGIDFNAGLGRRSYVQLGLGGHEVRGIQDGAIDHQGDITVVAGAGGVNFTGGVNTVEGTANPAIDNNDNHGKESFAQLGHGGYDSDGTFAGDISVTTTDGGVVRFSGGTRADNYVQMGHGGRSSRSGTPGTAAGNSGDITVNADGNVEFVAGTVFEPAPTNENGRIYAMMGHGGYDSDVFGDNNYIAGVGHNGDIIVNTTGSVNVIGGSTANGSLGGGNGREHFAMIGHGGILTGGDHAGAIQIDVDGDISVLAGDTEDNDSGHHNHAMIGHGGGGGANWGNTRSGNLSSNSVSGGTDGMRLDAGGSVTVSGGDRESFSMIGLGGRTFRGDHTGDVTIVAGAGGVSLSGGSDNLAFAQIGNGGYDSDTDNLIADSHNGSVSVTSVGDVIGMGGTGSNAYVQIGLGGLNSNGNFGTDGVSNVNVTSSGGNVQFIGGSGGSAYAHIGHGGKSSHGSREGNVTVEAGGGVTLTGGTSNANYAQIGHGGEDGDGSGTGDISVTANGGNIEISGGTADRVSAQIGHGGVFRNVAGSNHEGDIHISATGDLMLASGGVTQNWNYAKVGHGGLRSAGTAIGDICIEVDGGITLDSTSDEGNRDYTQIGHGGSESDGDHSGNISILAGSNISLIGGSTDNNQFAQIGHGGHISDGAFSGDIAVASTGGNISLTGGDRTSNYAMIGHGAGDNSSSGTRQGGVEIAADGTLTAANGGGNNVYVYHQTSSGLAANYLGGTGFQLIGGGGVTLPDSALGDLSTMINGNIGNGHVFVALSNDIDITLDSGDVSLNDSSNLVLATGGEINVLSSYQNAGDGDVTLIAGYSGNGTVASNAVFNAMACDVEIDGSLLVDFNNCDDFGLNGNGVTIGSSTQVAAVAVGSRAGTTTVAGDTVTIQASDSTASASTQLGFLDDGSGDMTGDINVGAHTGVAVNAGTADDAFAMIGHGGGATVGTNIIDAAINITFCDPGDLTLTSSGVGAFTMVGHGGAGSANDANGNITISNANNISVLGGSNSGAYSQIGLGGMAGSGELDGNFDIDLSGDLLIRGGAGDDAYAQIGQGGRSHKNGTNDLVKSGDIDIDGFTNFTIQGGDGNRANAQLGHGGNDGDDGKIGDITLTGAGTGDLTLLGGQGAGEQSYALIGMGGFVSNNQKRGAVTIDNVDDIFLTGGEAADNFAQIGNGGRSSSGGGGGVNDINLTAGGNLILQGGNANNTYVQVGLGGLNHQNGATINQDISVTTGGYISLSGSASTSGANAYAQIGHGGLNSAGANNSLERSGNITINAMGTDGSGNSIIISGGSASRSYAQIGLGGRDADSTYTGNIDIDAAGHILMNGGDGDLAYSQVGNGGANAYDDTQVLADGDAENSGSITIDTTNGGNLVLQAGNTLGSGGVDSYAQVGHGGRASNGDNEGDIDINLAGGLSVLGGEDATDDSAEDRTYAQVGHGGENADGSHSGNITINSVDDVELVGGVGEVSYAAIGHGGRNDDVGGNTGDISVTTTSGGIRLSAGTGGAGWNVRSYSHIGHGGANSAGDHSGDITLSSADFVALEDGNHDLNYKLVGHGGDAASGNFTGAINVTAVNDIDLIGGINDVDFAQIGHGGSNTSGSFNADIAGGGALAGVNVTSTSGAITVNGGRINQSNNDGRRAYAQIGLGGYNSNSTLDADISVSAATGLALEGGGRDHNYALIGNGGDLADGDKSGDIYVSTAAGNFVIQGGRSHELNAAQIGHGGFRATGNATGAIEVDVQAGSLTLMNGGGDDALNSTATHQTPGYDSFSYAQIGHGGGEAGVFLRDGEICVHARDGVSLDSNDTGDRAYAQIGHGGYDTGGDTTGDVTVVASNGAVSLEGGSNGMEGQYAQIGHGGVNAAGALSGNVNVVAGNGDMTLNGGDADNSYAMIGHGDGAGTSTGTRQGGVHLFSSGTLSGSVGSGSGSGVNVFHQTNGGLAAADYLGGDGFQMVANGGVSLPDSALNGVGTMIGGNLGNGPVSAVFSNNVDVVIDGPDTFISNSDNLQIVTGGDITFLSSYQNAGDGNITLVAGWGGVGGASTGSVSYTGMSFCEPVIEEGAASVDFNNCDTFGNGMGSITIGNNTQTAAVAVGTRQGLTTLAAYGLSINGSNTTGSAYSQLGFAADGSGDSTGNIAINLEQGGLNVIAGSQASSYAQIGHGGSLGTESIVNADIDISFCEPGAVSILGGGTSSYAMVGNGGYDYDTNVSGNVSLTGSGDVSITAGSGTNSFAKVGNGGNNSTADKSGDINITTGAGSVLVTGGTSDNAVAVVGHGGRSAGGAERGNITVIANGADSDVSVQGGPGSQAMAQIGFGGTQSNGTKGNDAESITVEAGRDINVIGGGTNNALAQVGHGGLVTFGTFSGDISLTAGRDVNVIGGQTGGDDVYAQVGHGGATTSATTRGNITVNAGGNVLVRAGTNPTPGNSGADTPNYAQIGHGGHENRGNHGVATDKIEISAANLELIGGSGDQSYAQVGNGGYDAGGNFAGEICVHVETGVILNSNAVTGARGYTQIGHGGYISGTAGSTYEGDIVVTSGSGGISLRGGDLADGQYAQIGHGGISTDGPMSGEIFVGAQDGGDLTITGGSANQSYAMVGHGDGAGVAGVEDSGTSGGTREGGIQYFVDGDMTVTNGSGTDSNAYLHHRTNEPGGLSGAGNYLGGEGYQVVVNGNTSAPANAFEGSGAMLAGSAGNGNIVFANNANVDLTFDGPDYMFDNDFDFIILTGGSIFMNQGYQNAGSGNVALVAGWDGTYDSPATLDVTDPCDPKILSASIDFNSCERYGNNNGTVYLGDATQTEALRVGSRQGTTTVAGYGLVMNASSGTANASTQLGFYGDGSGAFSGAIEVRVKEGGLTMNSGTTGAFTQIGHGGLDSDSDASTTDATISISFCEPGDININGGTGTNAYALIGHGGVQLDADQRLGDISIRGFDNLNVSGGSGTHTYAQIGHGGLNSRGNTGGDIWVQGTGAISLTGGTAQDAYTQIGHGGHDSNANHGQAGDRIVAIADQGINLIGGDTAGASYGAYAMIGQGGYDADGALTGDIYVNYDPDADMAAGGGDIVLFGSPKLTNEQNYGTNAQIGHGGRNQEGAKTGDIVIGAADSISLTGGQYRSYAQIGHGGNDSNGNNNNGTVTGSIEVNTTGLLDLQGGIGRESWVMIGHGGYNIGGDLGADGDIIDITAGGGVSLTGGDDIQSFAQIGNGGYNSDGTMNMDVSIATGGDITMLGGTATDTYTHIGSGGTASDGAIVDSDIMIEAVGAIDLNTGSASVSNAYAQIGHGGYNTMTLSTSNSNILINQGMGTGTGAITLDADGVNAYAQIGHGGSRSDANVGSADRSGNIVIGNAASIALGSTDGGGTQTDAYTQIGHGGELAVGTFSGDISLNTAGAFTMSGNTGGDTYSQVGHGGDQSNGDTSGSISLVAGGKVTMTGGSTNGDSFVQIGHGGRLNNGNHGVDGDSISVTGDGVEISAGSANNTYALIGNGGTDADGTIFGDVNVTSTGGDVTLNAGTGGYVYAQIGSGGAIAGGATTGDVVVDAGSGNVNVNASSSANAYAQIGIGGINNDGTKNGTTTVSGNDISVVSGTGTQAYAQIGAGGGYDGSPSSGQITTATHVNATGDVVLDASSNAAQTYVQIGGGGLVGGGGVVGVPDSGTNISTVVSADGSLTMLGGGGSNTYAMIGNGGTGFDGTKSNAGVSVTASDITMTSGNSASAYTQIGSGGGISGGGNTSTGAIDGDVVVTTTTGGLTMTSASAGNSNTYSQIGLGGYGNEGGQSGDITVSIATGITLDATAGAGANSYALIGNGGEASTGNKTGDISVSASDGSIRLLSGDGTNNYAQIGHGSVNTSSTQTGAISLMIDGGDLELNAGDGNFAQVGHGGMGDMGNLVTSTGDISVTFANPGDVLLNAGPSANSYAQIGHGGINVVGDRDGSISITDANDIVLQSGGSDSAYTLIGHGGVGNDGFLDGNIDITAAGGIQLNGGGTAGDGIEGDMNFAMIGHSLAGARGGYGGFTEQNGRVVVEAEYFDDSDSWVILEEGTSATGTPFIGSRNGYFIQLPDGSGSSGATSGSAVTYTFEVTTGGTYRLYPRWSGYDGASDSIFFDVVELKDGAGGTIADWYEFGAQGSANFNTAGWDTGGGPEENAANDSNVPAVFDLAPGTYTFRVTPREDGAAFDAFVLQLDNLGTPTGSGPNVSFSQLSGIGGGDINVTAGGDISLTSGVNSDSYAAIGHGGSNHDGFADALSYGSMADGANVTVTSQTGSVNLDGGQLAGDSADAARRYAVIGHHGVDAEFNAYGNVEVNAGGGDINLTAGTVADSFAHIGHSSGGGISRPDVTLSGNVLVTAAGAVNLNASDAEQGHAHIGHGGTGITGEKSGNVEVTGTEFSLISGAGSSSYTQIGHGGDDAAGAASGDVSVESTLPGGDLTMEAGTGLNTYSQVGHGGAEDSGGDKTGNVYVEVGDLTMSSSTGARSFTQIGHGGDGSGGAKSGTVEVITETASLQGGDGVRAASRIGHGGSGGNGAVDGSITFSASLGDISMIAGGGLHSEAQVGHGGVGYSGAVQDSQIDVTAQGDLLMGGGTGIHAASHIGHGGSLSSGSEFSGDITTVIGGDISILGGAATGASGQIGHGGVSADADMSGNISVESGGDIALLAINGDNGAYSKIGHGDDLPSTLAVLAGGGDRSGDIEVAAASDIGLVDAMIGHVNMANMNATPVSGITQVGVSRDDPTDQSGGDLIADSRSEFVGIDELRFYLPRRENNRIAAGAKLNGVAYGGAPSDPTETQGVDEFTINIIGDQILFPNEHENTFGTGPSPATSAGFAFYYDTIEIAEIVDDGTDDGVGNGGAGAGSGGLFDLLGFLFIDDKALSDWLRDQEEEYSRYHPFSIYYEGFSQYGVNGESIFQVNDQDLTE